MATQYYTSGAIQNAKRWLANYLRGGDKPAKQILADSRGEAFSERTLHNAKLQLGIRSYRAGSAWHWSSPPKKKSPKRGVRK